MRIIKKNLIPTSAPPVTVCKLSISAANILCTAEGMILRYYSSHISSWPLIFCLLVIADLPTALAPYDDVCQPTLLCLCGVLFKGVISTQKHFDWRFNWLCATFRRVSGLDFAVRPVRRVRQWYSPRRILIWNGGEMIAVWLVIPCTIYVLCLSMLNVVFLAIYIHINRNTPWYKQW